MAGRGWCKVSCLLGLVNPFPMSPSHCPPEGAPCTATWPFSRLSSSSYFSNPTLTFLALRCSQFDTGTVSAHTDTCVSYPWTKLYVPCRQRCRIIMSGPQCLLRCPRSLFLAVFAVRGAEPPLSQDGATFPGKFHIPGVGGCSGLGGAGGGKLPAGLGMGRGVQLLQSPPPSCSIPEFTPLCASF